MTDLADVGPILDARWGLTDRAAQLDDVEAIHEIAVMAGEAMGQPAIASRAEIEADLRHPHIVLATDTRVVHDAEGRLLAYAVFYNDRPGRSFADVYVRPALDRPLLDHLLDHLLARGINRALDDAQKRGLAETIAETGAQRGDDPMFDAFARNGYHHGRTWWRMQIDFESATTREPPTLPDAVEIVHVDPLDPDVAKRLYAIDEAAFEHHYGHVPTDEATWTTELRNEAGFDPTMSLIARVEGADAALLIGSDRLLAENLGYIDILGVLEEHRGRGLGRALLLAAFAEYAARGRAGVRLNVDSDNSTGATRLYESVGMVPMEVIETWELDLSLDDTGLDDEAADRATSNDD